MTAAELQPLAHAAAFWTALAAHAGGAPAAASPARHAAALALGAVAARLGWAALHADEVAHHPAALWSPAGGFCVLFVPLGPLLLARTADVFAALPLALAVARAGCLAAGCCHGPAGEPTPMLEIAGLLALRAAALRLPSRHVVPAVLGALAGLRLALEPWRAAPPLGPPLLEPAWICAGWLALTLALYRRRRSPSSRIGRRMLHQPAPARMRV